MTFAASSYPLLPHAGAKVVLTTTGATGTLVEWFLDSYPSGSTLTLGRLPNYAQTFTPDVPGAYGFTAHDLTRNYTPPRFRGDTSGAPTVAENGTAALTVNVPDVLDRTIGLAPDLVDVTLVAQGATVVAAMFSNPRTAAAALAMADATVLRLANACTGVAATVLDYDIATKAGNAQTKYEAHRIFTAGSVHTAGDSVNFCTSPRPPTTLDGAIAVLADVRTKAAGHFLENDSIHHNADTTNVLRAPTPTDVVSAHALADQFWSVLTAHMAQVGATTSQVHGTADTTNALTAQRPLAALNSAFIAAALSTAPTTPVGEQSAATTLVASLGFNRRR